MPQFSKPTFSLLIIIAVISIPTIPNTVHPPSNYPLKTLRPISMPIATTDPYLDLHSTPSSRQVGVLCNGGPGPFSSQALLIVQIVWLIVLGFSMLSDFSDS
ncbi:hypothetical protein CFP56_035864 [Quercus suber]|uniref:Transmembrane protein n=1 Tax=Quercus suber TaxID=58331 RepID=A0AAW0LPB2_QUESU